MPKTKKRSYFSIYFEDKLMMGKKKNDFTLAFDNDDPLCQICKELGSAKIKEIMGISTYSELERRASKEGRSLGNYVKYRLRKRLGWSNNE
jgi:hypothetical protein